MNRRDDSKVDRTWWWLAGILLFAALSRLLYLLFFRAGDPLYSVLVHDARIYHDWAAAIAGGVVWETGAFYQAPGYPYFLSLVYRLFGPDPLAAYGVQMILGLLSIVMIFTIATRVYGKTAGLAAAAGAALYGVYPFYETKLLSTSLAILLACLVVDRLQAAASSEKSLAWIPAGVAAGLACITRPNFLLLVLLVVAWIGWDRSTAWSRRLRHATLFLLGAIVMIAPVTIRNLVVSGEAVLISTNGGVTFYQGNNQWAEGWFTAPEMSGSIYEQREESRALAEASVGRPLSDAEVSDFFLGRGLAFIGNNPLSYLLLEGRKAFLALDNYEHSLEYNPQLDNNRMRFFLPLSFAIILALATVRFFAALPLTRPETPLLLVLVTQAATLLLFYAAGRYRLPATGPLLAIAGCGLIVLAQRLLAGWRAGWKPLVVVLAVALFSVIKMPPGGIDAYHRTAVSSACDLGYAYMEIGQPEEAVAAYERAIGWNPDYCFAHLDIGKALRTLGRLEEAENHLFKAIALQPDLAEAHFDLGSLYLNTRRLDKAARSFTAALRLDPYYVAAGNNLVGTYLTQGRYREALEVWQELEGRGLQINPELLEWLRRSEAPTR